MTFKTIETQEELDKVIGDRLKREREKVESEYKGKLEELEKKFNETKSLLDDKDSLAEESASKIKDLEGQVKGYEMADKKRNLALEFGLPYNLADRIQGESDEDMKKDAENLAKYFEKEDPILPPKNPEINKGGEGAYMDLLDGLSLEE